MQMTAGAEIHFLGEPYKIVYCDDIDVLVSSLDDRTERQRFSREEINQAYLDGHLLPFEHGFSPDEWRNNIEKSNCLESFEFADECERAQVEYRLPYALYFAKNTVSANEQELRCQEIGAAHDHPTVPTASTARRWASRYIESKFNPASLIDRRRKSFRRGGIRL